MAILAPYYIARFFFLGKEIRFLTALFDLVAFSIIFSITVQLLFGLSFAPSASSGRKTREISLGVESFKTCPFVGFLLLQPAALLS